MKTSTKSITLSLLVLLSTTYSLRAQNSSYFKYLTKVTIDTSFNIVFGYNKSNTRLINKPCYELDKNHPYYCDTVESPFWGILVAKFKNKYFKDSLFITYNQGLSADPSFTISTNGAYSNRLDVFECLELYLNSTGTIYTNGHTNNMFNTRRKYNIQKDTIIEVKQPYLYVGIKGKTLSPITLYSDRKGSSIIANLPINYEIEILLAEDIMTDTDKYDLYLVRTSFGLVGWLRDSGYGNSIIEDLFFAGD